MRANLEFTARSWGFYQIIESRRGTSLWKQGGVTRVGHLTSVSPELKHIYSSSEEYRIQQLQKTSANGSHSQD